MTFTTDPERTRTLQDETVFTAHVADVARAVDEAGDEMLLYAAVDAGDGLRSGRYADLSNDTMADLDGLLPPTALFAALATRVHWSPADQTPADAWLVVALAPDRDVLVAVRRIGHDPQWTLLGPEDKPWFARGLESALWYRRAGHQMDLNFALAEERAVSAVFDAVRGSEDIVQDADVVVNVQACADRLGLGCWYGVVGAEGRRANLDITPELALSLHALRDAMYVPAEGSWYRCQFTVTVDDVDIDYDFQSAPSALMPSALALPNARLLTEDLEKHPRTAEHMLPWMTEVLNAAA